MISKFKQWWAGLCAPEPFVSFDQLPPVTVRVPMPTVRPPRPECDDWASSYPHWNSPDVLPPVGCPIVLRIGCAVVQAERTAHIERRDREMTYQLPGGRVLTGRYEWSYP